MRLMRPSIRALAAHATCGTGRLGSIGDGTVASLDFRTGLQVADAAPARRPHRAQVARRAGETAAADVATPAAQRAQLFGAGVDASTFEGLGIDSSLADHLEGEPPVPYVCAAMQSALWAINDDCRRQ